MSITKKLKKAMVDKGVTQIVLAERTGRAVQTVRHTMSHGTMNTATFESYADAIGCDVVLRDRETGKIYD